MRPRRRWPLSNPYVIKADGLAAGKGVVIAQDRAEAEAAIDDALGGRYGAAGARVVIEEFLEGEIGSLFALCDGKDSIVFGSAGTTSAPMTARSAPTPAAWAPIRLLQCSRPS